MTIQKNHATSDGRVSHFSIIDISLDRLEAIARALQEQQDKHTITGDGAQTLQEILVALNMDKIDEQISNALA